MIDVKLLRTNPDAVRAAVAARGGRNNAELEKALASDAAWRTLNAEADELRARRNKNADEIGKLKRSGGDASALIAEMDGVKTRLKELEEKAGELERAVNEALLSLPNIPLPGVPQGKSAEDNPVRRTWGDPSVIANARDHQDIAESLGLVDFARASKLSGARFALLVGQGARLERALIQFMLDLHTREHGYTEIFPPFLVTRQTMTGTGQLPKFEDELYAMRDDDLFLIPTAEVPLTNMYRDEVFEVDKLPRALCAYTACFRREAGSYGKDTRGLIRNHQFNKIELVRFSKPEESEAELEKLTGHAEEILKRLNLPYRVVELCAGDLGFSSAKTYDLEVWMPGDKGGAGKGTWREISSCSTFTDFQARRICIRCKSAEGGRAFVHTLNGSGLAVGRTMAALLENYQQPDGSVSIPEALRPYMGTDVIKA